MSYGILLPVVTHTTKFFVFNFYLKKYFLLHLAYLQEHSFKVFSNNFQCPACAFKTKKMCCPVRVALSKPEDSLPRPTRTHRLHTGYPKKLKCKIFLNWKINRKFGENEPSKLTVICFKNVYLILFFRQFHGTTIVENAFIIKFRLSIPSYPLSEDRFKKKW